MKPWLAAGAIVIAAVVIWKLWSIVVDYKWAIVLAILAFGIGLLAWLIRRERGPREPWR